MRILADLFEPRSGKSEPANVLEMSRPNDFGRFGAPGLREKTILGQILATGDMIRLHGHRRFYGGNAANASGNAPPAKLRP